jgi:hypothetical protein
MDGVVGCSLLALETCFLYSQLSSFKFLREPRIFVTALLMVQSSGLPSATIHPLQFMCIILEPLLVHSQTHEVACSKALSPKVHTCRHTCLRYPVTSTCLQSVADLYDSRTLQHVFFRSRISITSGQSYWCLDRCQASMAPVKHILHGFNIRLYCCTHYTSARSDM